MRLFSSLSGAIKGIKEVSNDLQVNKCRWRGMKLRSPLMGMSNEILAVGQRFFIVEIGKSLHSCSLTTYAAIPSQHKRPSVFDSHHIIPCLSSYKFLRHDTREMLSRRRTKVGG